MLTFSFLTLFPELLAPFASEAIVGKARARGLVDVKLVNMRDFAENKHLKVDDTPYGGGAGMVIRVDVAERALASLPPADEMILFTPAGERFTQRTAEELSTRSHLAFLCGRYEGFDARVERLATRELSLGDFVMMGGEAAAACVLEAVARLVPGVLGDEDSHRADSFSSGLLDYPEYTRPPEWRGESVPEVLKGGNHGAVARWRREHALARTLARRPDLLASADLTPQDSAHLLTLGVTPEQLAAWGAPPPPAPKRRRKVRADAEGT
ncbi:tRNA (guanosine(37)-N1)-methyltransferase TrmD [Deinococcus metallilatus]|uniref:tRNA (guanine-N(1)-)-methyltransferase n=1 Tax=Deinococcus metallilatus TaxID=1211322 RepID=A0AAJ5JXU0_9DEIO|nr:tRNA (guanosine(37)-N1)-methyltransferase TrmD [Deinococcus metallilatus]MBB5296690.1 tRNA (guanine37-N1)-methyltransferase [Deinococcus metallilatus]QBY09226.1 tRNA (guanosine(37)-N1)-methyltransferase TrmD [Deinococcus metallilatus]RXJ09745.1 tRNA (guanosine(37)-N1)-methyltransferase TrmD [Deinococcus metallilatus]TLK24211.1 tRNA (guanosine(37)-N1)-methyltransferase TrmD [Deinococcus metallilatus]GMA13722.1 tRNA (guanine-N(1)-)-methyltransferase [Deinococcus metallilatus]